MSESSTRLRVGYVVKMFPRLSETFILNEILELERLGVDVVIFSLKKPNEGRFHPQLAHLKAPVRYVDDLDPKRWATWIGRAWERLAPHEARLWDTLREGLAQGDAPRVEQTLQAAWVASEANRLELSHLHAHFASLPSTIAYLAHRVSGIPFTFTAHAKDIFVYTDNEHYLAEKLQAAKAVVTVTEFNRAYLHEQHPGLPENRIRVLYNGIDLDLFAADPEVKRRPDLILSVGRLVPKKGFDVLLDALQILKEEGESFRCLIAGDGSEAAVLAQQRDRLGLTDEVTFLGARHRDEVLRLMQEAGIMCLPCVVAADGNQDALPTVLLEALACELPVVSTTVSGIPEIVESGTSGLLVSANDAPATAAALKRLLHSEDLCARLARQGRARAGERFDLRTNVSRLLAIFREPVADRRGTGTAAPARTEVADARN